MSVSSSLYKVSISLLFLSALAVVRIEKDSNRKVVIPDQDQKQNSNVDQSSRKLGVSYETVANSATFEAILLSPNEDKIVERLVANNSNCTGKERLLGILVRAGKGANELTSEDCQILPKWEEVVQLYGEEPIIYGLESCPRYREHLQKQRDGLLEAPADIRPFITPAEPQPRVGGLFNTGTNALAQSFMLNIEQLKLDSLEGGGIKRPDKYGEDFMLYNLDGGKHVPPKKEWIATWDRIAAHRWNVMPVVLIRDPMRWMQSMCRLNYNAHWSKGVNGHCPNLVPTEKERKLPAFKNHDTVPVNVTLKGLKYFDEYDSLAHLWTKWNRIYYDASFPRLMIRFEDTLFHAEYVMDKIRECVGLPTGKPFRYHLDNAKTAKKSADFATALAKYGTDKGRLDGLKPVDKAYLRQALDGELMDFFHYPRLQRRNESAVGEVVE